MSVCEVVCMGVVGGLRFVILEDLAIYLLLLIGFVDIVFGDEF